MWRRARLICATKRSSPGYVFCTTILAYPRPAYRNVHCDFWALYRRDFENVGVSIIHLDPGIDSGDVALQGRVEVSAGDSIFKVKARLAQLAADLALEALAQAREGTLPRQPQDSGDSGFYRTPTARQLMELFLRSR
jgi:methionyl-tRNA formyltransferase